MIDQTWYFDVSLPLPGKWYKTSKIDIPYKIRVRTIAVHSASHNAFLVYARSYFVGMAISDKEPHSNHSTVQMFLSSNIYKTIYDKIKPNSSMHSQPVAFLSVTEDERALTRNSMHSISKELYWTQEILFNLPTSFTHRDTIRFQQWRSWHLWVFEKFIVKESGHPL